MDKIDWEKKRLKWVTAEKKLMIKQISNKKEKISVFNARKSLYVDIEDNFLGRVIRFLIKVMIKRKLND